MPVFGLGYRRRQQSAGFRARDGELEARLPGRRRGSRLDAHEDFIVDMVDERRDITLNEMVVCLPEERGIQIVRGALSAWLRTRGFKRWLLYSAS